MKKATLTKALVLSALLIAGAHSLQAEEASVEEIVLVEQENHVQVGSYPLSAEASAQLETARQEEMQLEEQVREEGSGVSQVSGLVIPIKHLHLNNLLTSPMHATAAGYSHYVCHWIDKFPQQNIIKLEDGSEWILDNNDIGVIHDPNVDYRWVAGHTIVLTPKGYSFWGSNYGYVLTNTDLNVSVLVNPFRGPKEFGPNSTWVAGMHRDVGHVYLINEQGERTRWEVAPQDRAFFHEWLANQHVIFGYNDSWLWLLSSYDHILYNPRMDHFIRVRQITN